MEREPVQTNTRANSCQQNEPKVQDHSPDSDRLQLSVTSQPNLGGPCGHGCERAGAFVIGSGLPGIRDLPSRARRVQLDNCLTRIVEKELPENGVTVRRPDAPRAWIAACAAATATDAAYTKLLDAATAGEQNKSARATADVGRSGAGIADVVRSTDRHRSGSIMGTYSTRTTSHGGPERASRASVVTKGQPRLSASATYRPSRARILPSSANARRSNGPSRVMNSCCSAIASSRARRAVRAVNPPARTRRAIAESISAGWCAGASIGWPRCASTPSFVD